MALRGASSGSSGVVNPIPIAELEDAEVSPTNPSASIALETDGTLTPTGNGTVTGPNWFLPTTGGIGTSYWVRLTLDSGTSPTSGDVVGSWLQITASRNWAWARTTVGITAAVCTLEISSDSGGATVVASCTFNVTVEKS